jgi:hypothetical protein
VANKEQHTVEEVIRAVRAAHGLKAPTARVLGVAYNTIVRYERKYPTVAQAIREEREKFKDFLEHAFQLRVERGDTTAIIFGLKTLCKDRGYVERVEVEGAGRPDGEPIRVIKIVDAPTREEVEKANGGKAHAERRGAR